MNYLFFLLIIPFLIIPSVYAEQGKNYDLKIIDKGFEWTSHYERIDNNGIWQNFIFTNHPNYLQVETASGSVRLDKSTCEYWFYSKGKIGNKPPLLSDDVIPYRSIDGSNIWNRISNLDDASCATSWDGEKLKAVKFIEGIGQIDYIYYFTGNFWKSELVVKNESGLNNRVFGFEQVFNINRDTISFGGNQRNLDNFDGQTFDRTWLENNEAKVIDLLNGGKFDFDLGFNNLNLVRVDDTGADSSRLTFQYFYNQNILPHGETLVIDPKLTLSAAASGWYGTISNTGANCGGTGVGYIADLTDTSNLYAKYATTTNGRCYFAFWEFDTSGGIPAGADIYFIGLKSDITLTEQTGLCDFVQMDDSAYDLSALSDIDAYNNVTTNTPYLDNNDYCQTGTATSVISDHLGETAVNDFETHLSTDQLFTFALRDQDWNNRDATSYRSGFANNNLVVRFTFGDAIDDLTADDVRATAVDLSWTAPNTTHETITGYQVNYTIPHSENVATIATNKTANVTSITVTGLTGQTQYSFRVGTWLTTTIGNFSSNIVNVTTDFNPADDFEAGQYNITQEGTDIRNFKFTRTDINSTALWLNVTYPNTFNTTCAFYYKFAMLNHSYSNLADVAVNSAEDMASFRFVGVDNEIIDVSCIDEDSPATGSYLITQTQFQILEQIQNFQDGDYGTLGKFGAIDFITVAVIMLSMIGFNRVNEIVGVIIGVIIIGSFSVLGLIQWETTFTASLALVILWAYTNTRKP